MLHVEERVIRYGGHVSSDPVFLMVCHQFQLLYYNIRNHRDIMELRVQYGGHIQIDVGKCAGSSNSCHGKLKHYHCRYDNEVLLGLEIREVQYGRHVPQDLGRNVIADAQTPLKVLSTTLR